MARVVQGSNSIEGYVATLEDAVAVVDGDPTAVASEETAHALAGYRDALTYVLQVAQDDTARIDESLLRALHFMMLKHDLARSPGRWRQGPVAVRNSRSGEVVYTAPPADAVPVFVRELLDDIAGSTAPPLVRAAMAHLNLVMVHPFRDGNGRMARCLQTLVLAREHTASPVFSSIEEHLGSNTQAYYAVLAEVGGGSWQPERPATAWVRFCLTAHYRQAMTLVRRVQEHEQLWVECSELAHRRRVPERAVAALMDAALGLRIRNASYRTAVELSHGDAISELTATRDLKALVEAGLLEAVGERRARHYRASGEVRAVWEGLRRERPAFPDDPYAIVAGR